ncbi:MAG: hypothetical protein IIC51_09210 [Planctomycetes bacterium]|nr:hypothetical protein [Planctomycetota bacterium]
MRQTDQDATERAVRLRRMTAEYLRAMSPQERDRMMQVHLAQARGPAKNLELLRSMTAMMVRIRKAQREQDATDHG